MLCSSHWGDGFAGDPTSLARDNIFAHILDIRMVLGSKWWSFNHSYENRHILSHKAPLTAQSRSSNNRRQGVIQHSREQYRVGDMVAENQGLWISTTGRRSCRIADRGMMSRFLPIFAHFKVPRTCGEAVFGDLS